MSNQQDQSFEGKNIVITGSRGLALAMAKEFAKEKAHIILLARDADELAGAKNILNQQYPGVQVTFYPVDITDAKQIESTFEQITSQVGDISVWVNNAGSILVSPYDSLVEEDFRAQMELHLFAVVRISRMLVDHFRAKNIKGRIVNICSLGGKVAVPHMLTYDTSKFALAGFSQGLACEIASEGISVTTIYPTVMRTGSPIQAVFKGDHEKEYMWFATSDNLPFLSLDADKAAQRIVEAARKRKVELVPSLAAKFRLIAGVIFPQLMAWSMQKIFERLPKEQSKDYKTGAQSEGAFKRSPIYKKFQTRIETTEKELNQHPKQDAKFNLGVKTN